MNDDLFCGRCETPIGKIRFVLRYFDVRNDEWVEEDLCLNCRASFKCWLDSHE